MSNIKLTFQEMPKNFKIFTKVENFRQIWSHCRNKTVWNIIENVSVTFAQAICVFDDLRFVLTI